MSNVIIWVDRFNFKRFIKEESFTGWSDQSTYDHIQIIIPVTAIITFEEREEGICFECYEKELW
jgi:hypothetical protein